MEQVIEFLNVTKKYRGFTLDNVSFSVPKGFIMGLVGPNGAGKTTIIKLIMNLIRPNSGKIKVLGSELQMNEAEVKSRIGFVYDTPCYYEDISLKEIKKAVAPFYSRWDESTYLSLMEEFRLPAQKKLKQLSHGMKMKFSLAMALSHGADLIIMDEPTTGLDPVFRRELLEKFSALLQDESKTILFSTHVTSDLERVADYITFIRQGKIVFSATKEEIRKNWAIAKGGDELLSEDLRRHFLGISKSEFGVQALTNRSMGIRESLGECSILEPATLDDIMVFMEKGGKNGLD